MNVWPSLKNLKKDSRQDRYGNTDILKPDLLLKTDSLISHFKSDFIITSGTDGKHSPNSAHYRGEAFDIILIPSKKVSHPVDVIFQAFKLGFTGIGYYPDWKYFGLQVGGYHLDIRQTKTAATWLGVQNWNKDKKKFEREYIALNHTNLKKYLPYI